MQPDATTPEAGTEYRSIIKKHWQGFFDSVTNALEGRRVEIEVVGLDLGDQIQAESLPLSGFTFDPKDDTFYVYFEDTESSFEHAIPHPREISIHMAGSGFDQVVVVDDDGRRQFVRIGQSLTLPSAR